MRHRTTASNVISLDRHRRHQALGRYREAVQGIVAGEADVFADEKFVCFARSYIASGLDPVFQPRIELVVRFRDDRLRRPARLMIAKLRRDGFSYMPGLKSAPGRRSQDNPDQECRGPELTIAIDLKEARALFTARENSPFGAYQPSRLGFRTAHVHTWDGRGIGFSIMAAGYDDRRGDAYGNDRRFEQHIVDTDEDMRDLVQMIAAIERARITAV